MPIIPQTLNINNLRTTSAKSINLQKIRKLIENSLKNVRVKTVFTLTLLEILLFDGRLVLSLSQRVQTKSNQKLIMQILDQYPFYLILKKLLRSFRTKESLTVCSYHVTYAFQNENTPYSCQNAKEFLAPNRSNI